MARATGNWLEGMRGRRQWSAAEARRVVEAWVRSGESLTAFARSAGLVPQRVSWWRKQLGIAGARTESGAAGVTAAFVPVVVKSSQQKQVEAAAVVVAFGGVRMEVRDLDDSSAAWVARVLRTVAEVPS